MDYSEQLRGLVPQDTTHEAMQRSLGDGTDWRMRLEFMKMLANYIKSNAMGQPGGEWVNPDRRPGSEQPGIYATPENEMLLGEVDAWHGSPHKFEKFAMSKIGTGEGAQAFGHGLYFTSQKNVAKHYAATLGKASGEKTIVRGDPNWFSKQPEWLRNEIYGLHREGVPFSAWGEFLKNRYKRIGRSIEINKERLKTSTQPWIEEANIEQAKKTLEPLDDFIKAYEKGQVKKDLGNENLYKAKLWEGKDEVLLDWDKPIPKDVAEKLNKVVDEIPTMSSPYGHGASPEQFREWLQPHMQMTGQDIYRQLSDAFSYANRAKTGKYNLNGEKAASEFLQKAGIDGIRYPAGTLSGGGKGYNYVVFDEEAIKIK